MTEPTLHATSGLHDRLLKVLLVSSFVLAALTIWFVLWQLVRPYPLHSRETADIFGTSLLLRGQNPYSLETHPAFLYVYGIVSTLVNYPLALVFGDSLQLHRVTGDTFLVLSSTVLYWGMRVTRVTRSIALCGALLFFSHVGFNDFSSAPDSLALFLMFLSVVVPAAANFSWASVMAGGLFAILAFYTKEYFVVGAPLLMAYLFLFRSKLKALALAAAFATVTAISVWQIDRILPLYFTDVFYIHLNYSGAGHSLRHLLRVAAIYFPLAIGLVALLAWRFKTVYPTLKRADFWPPQLNVLHLDKPLLVRPTIDWVTFMLAACTAIWVFKLGQNGGNLMGYVYHLITPFLIWRACMVAGAEVPGRTEPLFFLQATVLLVAGFLAVPMLGLHKPDSTASWRHAADVISRHQDVLNAGALSFILGEQGKPVYDSGGTEYYPASFDHNPSPITEAYRARCRAFQDELEKKIRDRSFDAIMVFSVDSPALLVPRSLIAKYYEKTETFPLHMPFEPLQMEVWEPRPTVAP